MSEVHRHDVGQFRHHGCRSADGQADQHVRRHERIVQPAREQAAPGDHRFGPDAAHIRLQRQVEHPDNPRGHENEAQHAEQ